MASGDSPNLTAAITAALDYILGKRKVPFVKTEPVQAVLGDGDVLVGGDALRTSGVAKGIEAGDQVPVLYSRPPGATTRTPRRRLVLKHEARRGMPVPPLGAVTDPLVEEIFIHQVDGTVWFRNARTVQPLRMAGATGGGPAPTVREFMDARTSDLFPGFDFVQWGTDGASFVARWAGPSDTYSVFTLARTPNKPQGARVGAVSYVRTEHPWDKEPLLLTLTGTATGTRTRTRLTVTEVATEVTTPRAWPETLSDAGHTPVPADGLGLLGADVDVTDARTTTVGDDPQNPASYAVTATWPVRLTEARFAPYGPPLFKQPSAHMLGVTLNDAHDLIYTVTVDLWAVTTPIPTGVVAPGVASTVRLEPDERHLFLINGTTGTVLWKTAVDATLTDTVRNLLAVGSATVDRVPVTTDTTQTRTFDPSRWPAGRWAPFEGGVWEFLPVAMATAPDGYEGTVHTGTIGGAGLGGVSFGTGAFVDPAVTPLTTPTVAWAAERTYARADVCVDPALLAALGEAPMGPDLTKRWFATRDETLVYRGQYPGPSTALTHMNGHASDANLGDGYYSDSADTLAASYYNAHLTVTQHETITERTTGIAFSGFYVPGRLRPATPGQAPTLALGRVILLAFKSYTPTGAGLARSWMSAWSVDLDTHKVVPLAAGGTAESGWWVELRRFSSPEQRVLSASLSHALWYRSYQPLGAAFSEQWREALLSNLTTGATRRIALVTHADDTPTNPKRLVLDEFLPEDPDPAHAGTPSHAGERYWHLLRPDMLYTRDAPPPAERALRALTYPPVPRPGALADGGRFIVAWDAKGLPTLDPTTKFYPEVDATLTPKGKLVSLAPTAPGVPGLVEVERGATLPRTGGVERRATQGPSLQTIRPER